jgi:hypothetical protein
METLTALLAQRGVRGADDPELLARIEEALRLVKPSASGCSAPTYGPPAGDRGAFGVTRGDRY